MPTAFSMSHLLLLLEAAALCCLTARGTNELLTLSVVHISERSPEIPEHHRWEKAAFEGWQQLGQDLKNSVGFKKQKKNN